jgi:hypothetical protein
MVFQPRPRWFIVQTRTHEVHRMAKLRSRGEVKFMSCTIIVSYLVWVEQCMALTQKETLPSTSCHKGSRKGHFWITYCLSTISCLIWTRVVIRPEGHFFTRIITVELLWDGWWGKTCHMGSNCSTTCDDVNSSNGFRPKQGFNSGCNNTTFLLTTCCSTCCGLHPLCLLGTGPRSWATVLHKPEVVRSWMMMTSPSIHHKSWRG